MVFRFTIADQEMKEVNCAKTSLLNADNSEIKHEQQKCKSFFNCLNYVNNERLRNVLFHLGLIVFCCGYVLAGALLFRYIERPVEENFVIDVQKLLAFKANKFIKQLDVLNFFDKKTFEDKINLLIDDYQYALFEQFKHPIKENYFKSMHYNNGTYIDLWTLPMSILFTSTTIIPVGFGYIAPITTVGRTLVVIYSIIGLPLALITLSDIGKFFCALLFGCFRNSIKLTMIAMILILVMYPVVGSLVIRELSDLKLTDCFYFCIASMFTIGFGDIFPSIPLTYLICFVVTGVLLVTASVDLLASNLIHNIHYLGRQLFQAKRLTGKMFQMAQQVNFNGVLGAGLMQLNTFADIGTASIFCFRTAKKYTSTTHALTDLVLLKKFSPYEPNILLDYVDSVTPL